MKMTKSIESSCVGQKMIAAGTHASGGMGRSSSKTGKTTSQNGRLSAMKRPNGTAARTAAENPTATRSELATQLCQ